jgi:hypothetical protein
MSILNMTYHGYYTPHDRTTEAIAKAVNHTWDNLEKLAERVNKIEGDKDSTIAQLRDELAEAKHQAERAEKERDKLQAFKDYVHGRFDTAGIERDPESVHKAEGCRVGGRFDILISERNRYLKELDEALAKLQQPDRMIMRDGEKLWEVTPKPYGLPIWEAWISEGNTTAFRRPITADQLRAWLPSDAKPVGYVSGSFAAGQSSQGMIQSWRETSMPIPVYLAPPEQEQVKQ